MTVLGLPNVGKSSIINMLKNNETKSASAAVAPVPCFTRRVKSFVVNRDPNIVAYDTPGIFYPDKQTITTALKLSLVGTISDSNRFVENESLVKFLLLALNEFERYEYVELLGLQNIIRSYSEVCCHLESSFGLCF